MEKKKRFVKRKAFTHVNRYQRRIIGVVFFPGAFCCLLMSWALLYFHRELIDLVLYSTSPPSIAVINQWVVIILLTIWVLFLIVILVGYRISSDLVGAFDRIMRELDAIITEEQRMRIKARPTDDLANALLARINVLIERLPGPNTFGDAGKAKGRF